MVSKRTKTIQELNDRFRKGEKGIPGTVVVTNGVQSLLAEVGESLDTLVIAVQGFDSFTEDNDPYGEHDLGKFSFHGAELFWKIDQYNTTYDGGSEDPTDLTKTCRVLTIMLTHEY